MDGKQNFEVDSAKVGINPNDVVRVPLDKSYYMDEASLQTNKNLQDAYIQTIMEHGRGGVGQPGSRYNQQRPTARPNGPATRPNGPVPPPPPPPPRMPLDPEGNDENVFVPLTEDDDRVQPMFDDDDGARKTPRRET